MSEVCLVSPPARVFSTFPPFALLGLAGWLEREGIHTDVIEVKRVPGRINRWQDVEDDVCDSIIDRLKASSPRYVGIPCYTADLRSVKKLACQIRESMDVILIAGGVHATIRPEDLIFPDSPFELAIIGEGEQTLTQVVRVMNRSGQLRGVPGLVFCEDGVPYRTPSREPIEYLGTLPMPPYGKIDMPYYLRPSFDLIRYVLLSGMPVFTSRGCPYACTFCANNTLFTSQGLPRRVRFRPVKAVVDELEYLKHRYAIDGFYILDDTFSITEARVRAFTEELATRNLGLVWAMQTRVNLFTDQIAHLVKAAGCIQVEFGVESGSAAALKRMRKAITVEQSIAAFEKCHRHGLRTFANILINTPDETQEDVEQTVKIMETLGSTVYGIAVLAPLLGTDIYNEYVKPPLSLEEMYLYENPGIFSGIIDPRFKLATHELDIEALVNRLRRRFVFWRLLRSTMTLNRDYWRAVLASRRLRNYLSVFARKTGRVLSYARRSLCKLTV